jgi:nucleoside-diphosphate-sugar epimerase
MKTVLVTGANGFVGRALCSELIGRKYAVRAALRDSSSMGGGGGEVVKVTGLDAATDWTEAVKGVNTVIHLAARLHVMKDTAADPQAEFRKINVQATENLARQAARSGVKRLVYVSSIKVNGEHTQDQQCYTELDAPHPQEPYGISKYEAEQVLHRVAQETGLEVVVVRPPLVYGAGVRGNFAQMLKVLSNGVPLPLGSVHNLRSLIYVGNLVDALILCATHPAASGQTYLVSDGEDISTTELLRKLAQDIGVPARLISCPQFMLRLGGKLTGKSQQIERLIVSLQVDSGKICRNLNWIPPYSLQQGLQATAEWYRTEYT